MALKKYFPGISTRSWEHPADRAALTALRKLPGLDNAVRSVAGVTTGKALRLQALGSYARTSPRQFPRVFRTGEQACAVLDAPEMPEIYVDQSPVMNAFTAGADHPFIVVSTAMLDAVTDAELAAVIGHELGHALSGHAAYKTFFRFLTESAGALLQAVPLGGLALNAVVAAFNEWNRKSELSADRASLLVTQDVGVNYGALIRTIGGNHAAEIDLNELFAQADEYARGDVADSAQKLLFSLNQTHPWPVLRLAELQAWSKSAAYADILEGRYPRRGDDGRADAGADFFEAARGYRDGLKASQDPLERAAGTVAGAVQENLEQAGKQVEDFLRRLSGDR